MLVHQRVFETVQVCQVQIMKTYICPASKGLRSTWVCSWGDLLRLNMVISPQKLGRKVGYGYL